MKKTTAGVLLLILSSSLAVSYAQKGKSDTVRTQNIEGVVVTALGIKREKKSLGYSTQEVKGDQISAVPVANVSDALAGQVAGLNITQSGTMGGSTNMVIRGIKSLTSSNQALIVIDGTPINNETFNQSGIGSGGGGYDYSNGLADLNANDIESVNVLKGAAASALYGSRGMNGVVMITTKKGRKSKKIGIEFNSSTTLGFVDKSTLPKYQHEYGGGYTGNSFYSGDIKGNGVVENNIVYTYDDASFGTRFDPNLYVYNWDSQYPQLPGYLKPTPWVAGKDPNSIWNTAATYQNSIAFSAGNEKGKYRLGYTNFLQEGALDNSEIRKNTIDFSADYNFTEKLNIFGNINYINTNGRGRVYTGYESRNPMQGFRQWWNMSVDMDKQREAYNLTGQNITWNIKDYTKQEVGYTDNYFFNRNQNYQSDTRNRYFGNFGFNYKITDWISFMGRYAFDTFDELRQERVATGSSNQGRRSNGGKGEYYFMTHKVYEMNYDAILNINKNLGADFSLNGNVGFNLRRNGRYGNSGLTNGGLKVPGLYSITNSAEPLTEVNVGDFDENKSVDGIFAQASLGYKNMLFLDGSIRRDRSSTLPISNNTYWYPSGSVSFVFSELLASKNKISFGKVRLNYAVVGNDTGPYNLLNTYAFNPAFNGSFNASARDVAANPNLKPEMLDEMEAGLEMGFFKNRISFDVSVYQQKTKDLITPTNISGASGFTSRWINAGDIQNRGIEARLTVVPIKTTKFSWEVTANWSKNKSKVTKIYGETDFLPFASMWNVTSGAMLGESTGTIRGTNYVYLNGQRVVDSNGKYMISTNPQEKIGDAVPDWRGSIINTIRYKNLSLSFLIDVKKGGDVYSQDMAFGLATGLYKETAGLNDLGNPLRNTLANGGGVILPGVKADGIPNDIRAGFTNYRNPYGYYGGPEAMHVYDGSFVKLRNVTISYKLPKETFGNSFIDSMTLSLIGRNLWIIHKNLPYADPEALMSSGNALGFQNGAHPSMREIGASIKVEF
ncbi:SusC/RagA family TonB-linked outer membrane protein [Chryseobacterium sp. PTM-20240506]|uniref:SusC/RagA family TonB-linked outer membrane protein n=1 Tax=unclassified Chryseobacterium TaxID=2593645 RepID=UPI002796590D|nr:SusC/RagA family TonB-linked outer membrane protein [Chryseobacterium sp. CKR4-1]MDQ1805631.1 SusC/RagA family TonB-linked outer membrane protein [Chryseobacterium sp. CKR4-1]